MQRIARGGRCGDGGGVTDPMLKWTEIDAAGYLVSRSARIENNEARSCNLIKYHDGSSVLAGSFNLAAPGDE